MMFLETLKILSLLLLPLLQDFEAGSTDPLDRNDNEAGGEDLN
jgi:hypothetical protein